MPVRGRIDEAGLRRAWEAVGRRYPVATYRLVRSSITGDPAWRAARVPYADAAVRFERLERAAAGQRAAEWLCRGIDAASEPPVQFTIFQGERDDFLLVRCAHSLMDAGGLLALLGELERFYRQRPELESLGPAGEDPQQAFAELLATLDRTQRWLEPLRVGLRRRRTKPVVRIPFARAGAERADFLVRALSVEQSDVVRARAMRDVGGFSFADYVRGCGLLALHRALGVRAPRGAVYSTRGMLDHRRRNRAGPVFCNLFSTLAYVLPAELMEDRTAVMNQLRRQTRQMIAHGMILRRLAGIELMARLPTGVLAGFFERPLRRDAGQGGLLRSPSLPIGFVPASIGSTSFCGAEIENMYGMRSLLPDTPLAVQVIEFERRLTLCATYWRPGVSREFAERLVDEMERALLGA